MYSVLFKGSFILIYFTVKYPLEIGNWTIDDSISKIKHLADWAKPCNEIEATNLNLYISLNKMLLIKTQLKIKSAKTEKKHLKYVSTELTTSCL